MPACEFRKRAFYQSIFLLLNFELRNSVMNGNLRSAAARPAHQCLSDYSGNFNKVPHLYYNLFAIHSALGRRQAGQSKFSSENYACSANNGVS